MNIYALVGEEFYFILSFRPKITTSQRNDGAGKTKEKKSLLT